MSFIHWGFVELESGNLVCSASAVTKTAFDLI